LIDDLLATFKVNDLAELLRINRVKPISYYDEGISPALKSAEGLLLLKSGLKNGWIKL